MIRAENVSKIFGPDPQSILPLLEQGKKKPEIQSETGHVLGVDRASFSLEPGEVFCIMGLSGSGKSTLIRCINRLIEPTDGKIYLQHPERGELEITGMGEQELRMLRRHDMSMVFQHFALFPHRTVLSNVVYGLEIQGRDDAEQRRKGQEVLEMVGLGEWSESYPHELSGGMQQRVGLARALATDARVLLMDEPFSALDPLIKVNMQEELKKIQEELHRTILFITHDLDEAMRIGDRIAIMEAGRVVQIGTPEEILVNPRTEYVAKFVEHADPTGVITAGTIALPLDDPQLSTSKEGELTYYAREDYPEFRLAVDADGRLDGAEMSGHSLDVESLDDAVGENRKGERRGDVVLTCGEHTVVRQLLRGRSHTTVPTVVTDDDGRVLGVVDEPELISAILEKRGHSREGDEPAAAPDTSKATA